jgi:hypothetical protein
MLGRPNVIRVFSVSSFKNEGKLGVDIIPLLLPLSSIRNLDDNALIKTESKKSVLENVCINNNFSF